MATLKGEGGPALAGLEGIRSRAVSGTGGKQMAECTVCGKELEADLMTEELEEDDGTVYLCCPLCRDEYSG
jgi:hypothetical protein